MLRKRAVLRHTATEADGDGKTLAAEPLRDGASTPSPRQAGADIWRDENDHSILHTSKSDRVECRGYY